MNTENKRKYDTNKAASACFAIKGIIAVCDAIAEMEGSILLSPEEVQNIGFLLGLIRDAVYQDGLVS